MYNIEVWYRESFGNGTRTDKYDDAVVDIMDGGICITRKNNAGKKIRSFYPNISIIRVDIKEILHKQLKSSKIIS